jgi:hypothetical protein
VSESEWGARVGQDGSFVYRDEDDEDHSFRDVRSLARAWWSDSRGGGDWRTEAHPLVSDLLEAGHPASIDVLQALVDDADSVEDLNFVGAGPLEDLLSHQGHAKAFVDEIERRARQQPRFLAAVSGLWLGQGVPEAVRVRLCRLGATELE